MAERMAGGCACGRIRYTATVDSYDAYLCHCRMCQRTTGSMSIALKNVQAAGLSWETEPDWYDSSPIARRSYCRRCGTSLGFRFKGDADHLDLTVASFDNPARFRPTMHFGAESMHSRWTPAGSLPRYRAGQYRTLVERWREVRGARPG